METVEDKSRTTQPFEVLSGTGDDIAAALSLHERLLPHVRYDFWQHTEVQPDDVFLVARGPDLLGYLWGDLHGISGTVSYLREVGVEPKAQRVGVGRALIAEFARRAADAGCETIYVDPVEGPVEEDLIFYYERCGFTDPTRWRTTRHQRRGRNRMMEGSPSDVIRATTKWAPLIASNAWDVDGFGNGAFYEAHALPADVSPVHAGSTVLDWLQDERRTHAVFRPIIVVPSQNQATSAGPRPLTSVYEWTTPRSTHLSTLDERAVVALWPSEALLLELDANRVAPLAVVDSPIRPNREWAAARGASEIPSGDPHERFARCHDPVVEIALRDLSLQVNRNTGVVAPEDREAAVRTLRLLREGGHRIDPYEVFTFAIANRWYGEGAVQLRKLADGVLQGRRFSLRGHYLIGPESLDLWRRDASYLG